MLSLIEDIIDDICNKVSYVVTPPGGITGINPSNSAMFVIRKTEIANIKADIENIKSLNTKLV